MKITIFETEHFEGAFPVIKLFDTPGNEVSIITNPDTYRRFADLFGAEMSRFQWIIIKEKGKLAFFYSLYKNIRRLDPDLLYLNTISNNHLLYAWVLKFAKPTQSLLTVHDINCLFESRPGNSFRSRIIHHGKKKLTGRVDRFNVVADTLVDYLSTKTDKPISVIPGAVYEPRGVTTAFPAEGVWKIVVPGSIDRKRRDYDQVFALADLLNSRNIKAEIVLLGGHHDDYGKEIIQRAAKFKKGSCRMKYYEESIVDQDEFDQQMDDCHFVFIPSVVHTTICGEISEVYGITKSSGNIFDVIKHAKPFIVPATLTISESLASSSIKYESLEEIVVLLEECAKHPENFKRICNEAEGNSQEFTVGKVRRRMMFDE